MTEEISREEFDTLVEKFNDLVNLLDGLNLKGPVDFSDLEIDSPELYDDSTEEDEDNEEKAPTKETF